MQDWSSTLQTMLAEYSPQDIFNADDTGLFFCLPTDKTLEFKGVDFHGGKEQQGTFNCNGLRQYGGF